MVQFSSSSYSMGADQGSVSLTVYRLGSGAGAITVNYTTSDGLAVAGQDYTSVAGTLSWSANDYQSAHHHGSTAFRQQHVESEPAIFGKLEQSHGRRDALEPPMRHW